MNSINHGCKSTSASADTGSKLSVEGKDNEGSSYEKGMLNVDHLNHCLKDVKIDPNQDAEMGLIGEHSINQPADANQSGVAKAWSTSWGASQGTQMQSWGCTGIGRTHNSWAQVINLKESIGEGNSKIQLPNSSWNSLELVNKEQSSPTTHALQIGWKRSEKAGKPGLPANTQVKNTNVPPQDESVAVYDPECDKLPPQDADGDDDVVVDDDELLYDSEDDASNGFDSDDSQKSHDTRKKNKWLRPFFESLDKLGLEEINSQTRQWHCPACQDGPGAIAWYIGLQPLMTHAKTKGRVRMRLHKELAELLEEELRRRGISVIPAGEAFRKWKGLQEATADYEIVWPPMVVVMNTLLEKDENDKWKGMGNQELLEYFNTYEAVKARHSYGPKGHRGMSVLIFEASAMGYLEAERLHKQFVGEGRDRDAWEMCPVLFYPGGKRQLYGFLASKEDMVIFNKHSRGKSGLKFETRSYQEMVLSPMKQMSEDNQKLFWLKNKVVKQEKRTKVLEETVVVVSQKLRDTMEENRIVKLRTKIQHEENKEEMDYQEKFFKDQMDKLHMTTEEKERAFGKLLQEEWAKLKQSDVSPGTFEDCMQRKEEIQRFIADQVKGVEEFEVEKAKLIHAHEEMKTELKHKHLIEEIQLGKDFDVALKKLMEKYAPPTFQLSSSSLGLAISLKE